MPRYRSDQLLAVAGDQFRRYGYIKTRMENVAAQVPCSKVTLYKHYPDKVALAEAWLGAQMGDSRNRTSAIIESAASFADKVARMIEQKQRDLTALGEPFFRDMFSGVCPEPLQACVRRQVKLNKQQVLTLFALGRASGDIHPDFADDLLTILLDHFERLFTDPAFLDRVPPKQRVDTLVGLFLYGVSRTAPNAPGVPS